MISFEKPLFSPLVLFDFEVICNTVYNPYKGYKNEQNTINNFMKCLWLQYPVVVACVNIFDNPKSAKKIGVSPKKLCAGLQLK